MNKLLKYSFLWLLMLMGVVSANAQDQTLTIADNDYTNWMIPYRFDYADAMQTIEYVIPASELAGMSGSTIKAMKFYADKEFTKTNIPTVKIFMKEVASEGLSSLTGEDGATVVYQGTITVPSSCEMEIPFSTNYSYNGGNLLIGFYTVSTGDYIIDHLNFYGDILTYQNAESNNIGGATASGYFMDKFIPKTTFTYEAGSTPVVVIDVPTFDVAAGTVEEGTVVTIKGNSDKLVYTTDGTNPTLDNGTVVNGTTVTVTINETTTLKAIAADNDGNVSAPRSATYTVIVPTTKIAQVMEKSGSGTYVEWIIKDDPSYKVQFVKKNDTNTKVYLWDGARGIVLDVPADAFEGFETGDVIKGGKLNVYMSSYDYYAPTLNSILEPLVKGENLPVTPIEGDLNSYTAADKYTFITLHGTMIKASWGDYFYVNSTNYQIDNGENTFGITEDVDEAAYENKEGTFTLVRNDEWGLFPITADYFVADAPAAVAVEIGAAGAATFSSKAALDFTEVHTIVAYIAKEATSGNSALEFTRVYKVPANTGLLIRNTGGEEKGAVIADVPVLVGEAENVEGNLFVAATEEIASLPSVDGEYTNYILNKKNGVLGFYKANGKKVAAGKAYLKMLTGSGAAEFIGFDGEVTAIESLTVENANNEIFDLQGRRVAKAAKGVYIVNGKKVVLK